MDTAANYVSDTGSQISFFESVIYLLLLEPIFLIGLFIVAIALVIVLKKNSALSKMKIVLSSLLTYYYLCIVVNNVVGTPTIGEFIRLSKLGEPIFNPNINLVPCSDGMSFSFILNIFLFMPLGFLCPMISKKFESIKNTVLMGFGLSLCIEISQLFTLHRATDIDDLLTNVIGTVAGYYCYRLLVKLKFVSPGSGQPYGKKDSSNYLPVIIVVTAMVLGVFR